MHVEASGGWFRRAGAAVATAALLVGGLTLTGGAAFAADPPPTPPTPQTVTADALPTWQINGVVWSQVVVGTTVYVAGSFTKARPPGVAAGGAGEIDALNIFAYDITTGDPVASFNHSLNAQGLAIAASPDGSRVYVGGDFTTVDGASRAHIASFATANNSLTSWSPNIGGQVRALATTAGTVYAGGSFPSAGGQTRASLAAFSATSTTLLDWAPAAGGSNATVLAMIMSPDQSRVILAGSFETLSGVSAYGMGSVDASTGAVLPWAANTSIRTAGLNGGITSLSTDGTQVFGTGYAFGSGASFEGTFSADPSTGAINWINDCLGDNYSTFPLGQVLYSVAHQHDCTVVGSFPDTSPRSRWQKALAAPTFPTGMITVKDAYGWDFRGFPYAGILHWFPDFEFGNFTPDRQAAWNVTGSGNYLTFGGEFPMVNGVAQQGLVRFALPASAPKLSKPIYTAAFNPVATSTEAGRVRLFWKSVWDRDDASLTYDVYRDGGPTIGNFTAKSNFWTLPGLSFTDTGVAPGTTHTYKVRAKDKDGNVQWSLSTAPVTVSADATPAYLSAVRGDDPLHHWRLNDAGPGFIDSEGAGDGTSTSVTWGQTGATAGDAAVRSSGGTSPKLYTTYAESHPSEVTVQAWMQTTSSSGGRIIGFGSSQTNNSVSNDLVLYVNSGNRIGFATANGTRSVTSTRTVNDGQWHLVTATAGADGISLYVDGRRVGRDQAPVTMATFQGFWRMFADQTSSLPNKPSNAGLSGTIDEVSVFPSVLSQSQIQSLYLASGRSPAWTTPAPADSYGAAITGSSPDFYWRLNETSGSTVVDSSASGQDGTVVTGVSFGATGSPASTPSRGATFNGSSGLVVAKEAWNNPKTYTAEAWFKTTTTRGGKIIGFGSATTGLSTSYDRQIVMLNNGRLQFGTDGAVRSLAETTTAYNNGQWHHVAATQGADGMKLYVDGVLVASNAATDARNYVGYWRLGGDRTFGGTTSNYFAGDIDEVAVYPVALTGSVVRDHYEAAGQVAVNQPPTGAFTVSKTFLAVSVDGSGSTDPDGTISSYSWNWGDGTPAGSGVTATHTYAAAGTYTVTLTVTDNDGGTDVETSSVTVAANQAPTASFTDSETFLALSVNGSASSDPEGAIASYSWNWGDGTPAGSGATASHTYAAAGTYTVALTVTDGVGATGTSSRAITVSTAPNQPPTASFTHGESFLTTSVNGSASSDPDGTIASYAWSWDDGTANGSGATATHTYAAAGTYSVQLTVTDNEGATNSTTSSVTVAANVSPTASFTDSETFLALSVNGSASSDPDGSIASYAWKWGDGTADGSGATATHTYAAAGTYTVRLTVTDGQGATGVLSRDITVVALTAFAQDAFGRTLASGWGSADVGGPWTLGGVATRWSVSGGLGRVSLNAGDGYTASLPSISNTDNQFEVAVTTDKVPTGGGQYISVIGRRVTSTADYRAKIRFAVGGGTAVWLTRNEGATETVLTSLTVPGLVYNTGDKMQVKLQTYGTNPTTIRVKIWKSGTTEPAAWVLTATDSTAALQAPGSAALYAYLSGSTTNGPVGYGVDDLWIGPRN
jgi:PKD repeat protein